MSSSQIDTALLVIDVQVGMFASPLIPPIHSADALFRKIAGLILRARVLKVLAIFMQHRGGQGHPLQKGTKEFHIHPAVAPAHDEVTMEKRFYNSFQNTSLEARLESRRRVFNHFSNGDGVLRRQSYSTAFPLGMRPNVSKVWANHLGCAGLKGEQIIAHINRVLGELFATLATAGSTFRKAAASRAS